MEIDVTSGAFWSALLAIVLIDLVLAGDNALIIGLVARNLPKNTQRKVILWGTFGAIAVRAVMAILVVYILAVPGFMLAGGLALIWIARKLLTPDPDHEASHAKAAPATTFAGAVRTVVIADAVMGIDNVLGIGGAAQGSVLLIVFGLIISVPIIVWGSHLVIRLVDRFPSVILIGGAVLAWTAYTMIVREPFLVSWFEAHPPAKPLAAILVFAISLAPWYAERLPESSKPLVALLPGILAWMLAIEVAGSYLKVQIDYLLTSQTSGYALEAIRWLGWLPFAAAYLWAREKLTLRSQRAARS